MDVKRMSGRVPRTVTFPQTRVAMSDTACSVKGLLRPQITRLVLYI